MISMNAILFMPVAFALCCYLCVSVLTYWLMKPRIAIQIGPWKITGLLPGHMQQWSDQLATVIYDKIVAQQPAIEAEISSEERIAQLLPFIEGHIDEFLRVKLPVAMPMIGMLIGDKTIQQIKDVFVAEIKLLFPKILLEYFKNLTTDGKLKILLQKQLQEYTTNAYLERISASARPLFFKIKMFSILFGLLFGAIIAIL